MLFVCGLDCYRRVGNSFYTTFLVLSVIISSMSPISGWDSVILPSPRHIWQPLDDSHCEHWKHLQYFQFFYQDGARSASFLVYFLQNALSGINTSATSTLAGFYQTAGGGDEYLDGTTCSGFFYPTFTSGTCSTTLTSSGGRLISTTSNTLDSSLELFLKWVSVYSTGAPDLKSFASKTLSLSEVPGPCFLSSS